MFNDDAKKSFIKKHLFLIRTNFHYHLWFKKRFTHIDGRPRLWGIWNIIVYGPNISMGRNVVIVGGDGYKTNLTSLKIDKHEGKIDVGNNVLIMNGVRISSASEISIGDDCMLGNFCYLMDADWHDIYDRWKPIGKTAPIILEKGVWIGDSAIVCKGVRIGENSVIGAGSVVTKNIPSNVIAAGNPASVIKELDPDRVVPIGKALEKLTYGQKE